MTRSNPTPARHPRRRAGRAEAMTVTSPDATTANVVCGNVQTADATVHLIDAVLMPAS